MVKSTLIRQVSIGFLCIVSSASLDPSLATKSSNCYALPLESAQLSWGSTERDDFSLIGNIMVFTNKLISCLADTCTTDDAPR